MTENEISYLIRGAIFKVYNTLGPGLFESVYLVVLKYELEKLGLLVKHEVPLPLIYDEVNFDIGFRLDLVVNNKVIIELQSVEKLAEVHHKQLITYLKLSKIKLGLLVNFNTDNIATSIFRKVNGL
jgi:GxxExxY protein